MDLLVKQFIEDNKLNIIYHDDLSLVMRYGQFIVKDNIRKMEYNYLKDKWVKIFRPSALNLNKNKNLTSSKENRRFTKLYSDELNRLIDNVSDNRLHMKEKCEVMISLLLSLHKKAALKEDRKLKLEDVKIFFPKAALRVFYSKYKPLLKGLEDHKFIRTDINIIKKYDFEDDKIANKFSKAILLNNKLLELPRKREVIKFQNTVNSLKKFYTARQKKWCEYGKRVIRNSNYNNIQKYKESDMEDIIKKHCAMYEEECRYFKKKPKSYEQYKKLIQHCMLDTLDEWNDTEPENRHEFCNIDEFGQRIHTPFTSCFEELRANVYKDGKQVGKYVIDLAQSQPTFLAHYMGERLSEELLAKSKFFQIMKNSDDVYTHFAEANSLPSRTIAKKLFIKALYCKLFTNRCNKHHALLEAFDPILADFVKKEKSVSIVYGDGLLTKPHASLSFIMQRAESKLFKQIWIELFNVGIHNLGVHDSFYFNESQETIKKIFKMLNVLTADYKVPFNFKLKTWNAHKLQYE